MRHASTTRHSVDHTAGTLPSAVDLFGPPPTEKSTAPRPARHWHVVVVRAGGKEDVPATLPRRNDGLQYLRETLLRPLRDQYGQRFKGSTRKSAHGLPAGVWVRAPESSRRDVDPQAIVERLEVRPCSDPACTIVSVRSARSA